MKLKTRQRFLSLILTLCLLLSMTAQSVWAEGEENQASQPQQGDILFTIGNEPDGGKILYSFDNQYWNPITERTILAKETIVDSLSILLKTKFM